MRRLEGNPQASLITKEPESDDSIAHLPCRKNFSHSRNKFPSRWTVAVRRTKKRVREFEPDKLVAVGVRAPHGGSPKIPRSLGQCCTRNQGRTGNFQRN